LLTAGAENEPREREPHMLMRAAPLAVIAVHDPGLGRMQPQPHLLHPLPDRLQPLAGPALGGAGHDRVAGVPLELDATLDQSAAAADLDRAAVRARVAAGQVNTAPSGPGRTVGQILRANMLTRFNAILGSLFVVVGPPQDALFGIVLVVNTGFGVVQELRAKRTLDKLAILTAARHGPSARV
jgi:hypothetical protein